MSDPIIYDESTDSMYVTLQEGRVTHSIAHDDRDFAVDIGEDGKPIGYNIELASKHPAVIAEAPQMFQSGNRIAAE